jgi:hypothetical protein
MFKRNHKETAMLRKLFVLAITGGLAKKAYDKYQESHNPLAAADAELAATEGSAGKAGKSRARKPVAKAKGRSSKPSAA